MAEEKKKSRELTFNVYTASYFDEKSNNGTYGFCIVDRYEKKTTIIEKINDTIVYYKNNYKNSNKF